MGRVEITTPGVGIRAKEGGEGSFVEFSIAVTRAKAFVHPKKHLQCTLLIDVIAGAS